MNSYQRNNISTKPEIPPLIFEPVSPMKSRLVQLCDHFLVSPSISTRRRKDLICNEDPKRKEDS